MLVLRVNQMRSDLEWRTMQLQSEKEQREQQQAQNHQKGIYCMCIGHETLCFVNSSGDGSCCVQLDCSWCLSLFSHYVCNTSYSGSRKVYTPNDFDWSFLFLKKKSAYHIECNERNKIWMINKSDFDQSPLKYSYRCNAEEQIWHFTEG